MVIMVIIINVITISMVINLIRYTYPAQQQQIPVVVHDTVGQHDSDDNDDCAQVVVKEPQVVVQERVVIKEAPRPWASHRVIAITIIIIVVIIVIMIINIVLLQFCELRWSYCKWEAR